MFSTFSVASESKQSPDQNEASESSPRMARSKRHQVARACVWCRTYRIRCDANYPCRNCQVKGRKCTDEKGKADVRTFPRAIKEIERLKDRVKELENQLGGTTLKSNQVKNEPTSPANRTMSLPTNLDPLGQHGGNKKYYNWDFILAQTARSDQQCYGPSSLFYFIDKMTSHLNNVLQQRHPDIQLTSESKYLPSPVSALQNVMQPGFVEVEQHLSRSEEEFLLEIFWKSYYWIYPILDEAEFRAYHSSMWETSEIHRKPSALVDIILAICMQHNAALVQNHRVNTHSGDPNMSEGTIAGRWFYRRCQTLLTDELEGPSLMTLQCQIFAVIWLSNASFQNMAHSVMAMAIRTGVILGLNMEPSGLIPESQREFRKRLWWTLYALEMKMGMDLGRPISVNFSQVVCPIPEDYHDAQSFPRHEDITVTCFNTHFIKLMLATRAVYITFYRRCAELKVSRKQKCGAFLDTEGLELLAEFLESKTGFIKTWLEKVPESLQTLRRDSGRPFSTDRSPLELSACSSNPIWLPWQGVYLELLYHDMYMSLYRPFVTFFKTSPRAPITVRHAMSCADHAITTTDIIYQILTNSDLPNGWHEILQLQWNATLTLVGFLLTWPSNSERTSEARKSLSTAIGIFELLSNSFTTAVSAATVARDLSAKVDLLIGRSEGSSATEQTEQLYPYESNTPYFQGFDTQLDFATERYDSVFTDSSMNTQSFEFSFDPLVGFGDDEYGNVNFQELLDLAVLMPGC